MIFTRIVPDEYYEYFQVTATALGIYAETNLLSPWTTFQ